MIFRPTCLHHNRKLDNIAFNIRKKYLKYYRPLKYIDITGNHRNSSSMKGKSTFSKKSGWRETLDVCIRFSSYILLRGWWITTLVQLLWFGMPPSDDSKKKTEVPTRSLLEFMGFLSFTLSKDHVFGGRIPLFWCNASFS